MKKLWVPLVVLLCLGGLVLRALRLPAPVPVAAAVEVIPLDESELARHLSAALQLQTISHADPAEDDATQFEAFHALLQTLYPRVYSQLQIERVGRWALLLRWPGTHADLKPALLAAHMDVVPVEPGTERQWTRPPFSGAIADGFVWGRGALDDKSNLLSQLEAVETLLAQGFAPTRTLYFAFGDDEEVGGFDGAARMAALLHGRGVQLAYTLDEGSAITQGIIAGVKPPVAAIMVGEKGYVTFRLTAHGPAGHSSMPTADNAIVRLTEALDRLQQHPMPTRLIPAVTTMLTRVAPEMPFAPRLLIANRDLFAPLLLNVLARKPVTNAMVRTTQAITVIRGGVKDNVLPGEAHALVNYRLLPGDRIADVAAHIRRSIDDPGIDIAPEPGFANEAPPLSDPDAPAFALIAKTVNQVFPGALVSSGIVMATTDNRYYAGIRDQGYAFSPFVYTPADETRIHGTNERIPVADYANMVRFYVQLLQNSGV